MFELSVFKGTYSVEPEFGEWRIIKLKEPSTDGNFANLSAAFLLISLPGSCISVGILHQQYKVSDCKLSA